MISGLGIILCLGTSIAWSCADVFRKKLTGHISSEKLSLWIVLMQLPLFGLWAILLPGASIGNDYWLYALLCGFLNSFTVLGMLLSFQMAPISMTIPLLSLTPLFSAVFEWFISGKELSSIQWLGLGVASLGATALGAGKEGWFREVGAWIMIGVAILFSLLFALDGKLSQEIGAGPHSFFETVSTAGWLGLYLFFRKRSELAPPNSHWGLIIGAALAMTIALGVQLYAYQIGVSVSIVEATKRSFGIFASLALGYFLFQEGVSKSKISSALVLTVGIVIVLLAG